MGLTVDRTGAVVVGNGLVIGSCIANDRVCLRVRVCKGDYIRDELGRGFEVVLLTGSILDLLFHVREQNQSRCGDGSGRSVSGGNWCVEVPNAQRVSSMPAQQPNSLAYQLGTPDSGRFLKK